MARSIQGSGSLMPESAYLKKMEQTCIYEDPDQLENFYRNSLKDLRPDKPFFESDAPRRNNFSRDRLNLRHGGARSLADPYLPDGTFLDHVFLEKDPRGNALEPDMRQYRKQQEARGKFIKHGNDEDNSVPSSGWHPSHVVRDIKNQFYNVKSRMKIFEESMDGRHNGSSMQTKLKSTGICLQENDAKAPIMRDEMCYNKARIVNDLSNDTSIGWRRTTDHRFKIAKYGLIRNNAPLSTQDWSKNRANARVEHDILVSWKDQTASKALSLKMIDMMNKKKNDMETGEGAIYAEATETQNGRSRKITPADLIKIQRDVDESRAYDPNTILGGEQSQHTRGLMPSLDSQKAKKVIIDPVIMDFMASINRKMSPRERDDLREQILQSNENYGILLQQKNRGANPKLEVNNELLWNSCANYEKGKSMKAANYGRVARNSFIEGAKNQNAYNFEQYKRDSKSQGQRRGNIQNPDLYAFDAVDFDNEYGREIQGAKLVGVMGSKYTNHLIDREKSANELMDITALTNKN